MFAYRISSLFVRSLPNGRLRKTLMLWFERSRQRRRLLELDDRMLRDIGVKRSEALREAARPFWEG